MQDFKDASQNAQDPDVKKIATKLTPTLERHLQKAQQIDQKLGGRDSSVRDPKLIIAKVLGAALNKAAPFFYFVLLAL